MTCPTCKKEILSIMAIKHHGLEHTGMPFFECKYCPTYYLTKDLWKEHRIKAHPKVTDTEGFNIHYTP